MAFGRRQFLLFLLAVIRMKRVLFLMSHLNRQGPVNQLLYLCRNVSRSEVAPLVVTSTTYDCAASLRAEFAESGVEVIDLGLDKTESMMSARQLVQQIIDARGIDVVQSYGWRSDFIAHNLERVFRVTTVRNILLENYKYVYGPLRGYALGLSNLYLIKRFDKVVACSFAVKRHLETLGVNSCVIMNAIERWGQEPDDATCEKRKGGQVGTIAANRPLSFLTVSSRRRGKNAEFLLRAFARDRYQHYSLLVAGHVERGVLRGYSILPNVEFLGYVPGLRRYMGKVDFFLSASLHEGMPNAVLESISVGTPVILSDIAPHEEILEQSRQRIGVVFQNNNYDSLTRKIEEIASIPYAELACNCVSAIHERFSASEMARSYESLYSRAGVGLGP